MKTIRWFILPVACIIGGGLYAAIIDWVGQWAFGSWQLTSGVVVYCTAALYVTGWVQAGRLMAPQKSLTIQRAIASPLLVVALALVIGTIKVLTENEYSSWTDFHLSDSLSYKWQYVIFTLGFLVALAGAFTEE